MSIFKKQKEYITTPEERFLAIFDLIKDLDKRDFNSLQDGLELAYKGYEKIRKVQTRDERENEDVETANVILEAE